MKTFFKCTVSALAVTAMVVLAFLSGGCNKNPEKPSDNSLLGTWSIEFEEEEMGGSCAAEYTFQENGEGIFTFISHESGNECIESMSMLWYTEGNKLYLIDKENKEFYCENGVEWESLVYEVTGKQLDFYENGEVIASYFKKQ